jgi:hypothetical protein
MLRTDLSGIESLRSLRSSVQILLYWFLESVLDRSDLNCELRNGNFGSRNADCGMRIGSGAGGGILAAEVYQNPQFAIRETKFDSYVEEGA